MGNASDVETGAGAQPVVRVPRPGPNDPHRILVVAADEHITAPLREELRAHRDGRPTEVSVVAPAFADSRLEHVSGNIDESREVAQERLEKSVEEAREAGVEANGFVGDSDPLLAIEDALRRAPAEEIVLVTHHEGTRWLEGDLFERASQRFDVRIVHYEVFPDGHHERTHSSAGAQPPPDAEYEPSSGNLPPMSIRDIAGIIVAIVGTIVLIVLAAADSEGVGETAEGGVTNDTIRMLLAGAFGLINLTHVVGLILMGSVRYRGAWERFFANLSLYGTATAIVISIILL